MKYTNTLLGSAVILLLTEMSIEKMSDLSEKDQALVIEAAREIILTEGLSSGIVPLAGPMPGSEKTVSIIKKSWPEPALEEEDEDEDSTLNEGMLSTAKERIKQGLVKTGQLTVVGAATGGILGGMTGSLAGLGAGAITGTLFGVVGGVARTVMETVSNLLRDKNVKNDLSTKTFEASTTHMNVIHLQRMLEDYLVKGAANKLYFKQVYPERLSALFADNYKYYENMRKGAKEDSLLYTNCTKMMNAILNMSEKLAERVGKQSLNLIKALSGDAFSQDPSVQMNKYDAQRLMKKRIESGMETIDGKFSNIDAQVIHTIVGISNNVNKLIDNIKKAPTVRNWERLDDYIDYQVEYIRKAKLNDLNAWNLKGMADGIEYLATLFDGVRKVKTADLKMIDIPKELMQENVSFFADPLNESVKSVMGVLPSPTMNSIGAGIVGGIAGAVVGTIGGPVGMAVGAAVGATSFFTVAYASTALANSRVLSKFTSTLESLDDTAKIHSLVSNLRKSVDKFQTDTKNKEIRKALYLIDSESLVKQLANVNAFYTEIARDETLSDTAKSNLSFIQNSIKAMAESLSHDLPRGLFDKFSSAFISGEIPVDTKRTYLNPSEPGISPDIVEINIAIREINTYIDELNDSYKFIKRTDATDPINQLKLSLSQRGREREFMSIMVMARSIKSKIEVARQFPNYEDDTGEIAYLYRDVLAVLRSVLGRGGIPKLKPIKALSITGPSKFTDSRDSK